MSHQIRPGSRGGRDQFSWDQVKEDKQRSNYLGSSIHGLPDKFKKGPETFWYAKETKTIPEKKSEKSEIELLKEKEKMAMEMLLGGNLKTKNPERGQGNHELKPERRQESTPMKPERHREINPDSRYRNNNNSSSIDKRHYNRDERRYRDEDVRENDKYYNDRRDKHDVRDRENYRRNYSDIRTSSKLYK